jgi:excisionase family DNA binding protein
MADPFRALKAEPLLTTRGVAEVLGISSEAVLRLWRAGELPGFRLSTRVLRFRESELMAWLEDRRAGPLTRGADTPTDRRPETARPKPVRWHAR